jgi:hypothetical protein
MGVKLEAPLPAIQTISFLPNPQKSDVENQLHKIDLKRAMDGTKYTYVKSNDRRRLTYEFRLTRMKGLELKAFLQSYYSSLIRMTNHKDEVWEVKVINNPFEFSSLNQQVISIQLQLEGVKI